MYVPPRTTRPSWTIEAAIPLGELTATASPRSAWACNVVRPSPARRASLVATRRCNAAAGRMCLLLSKRTRQDTGTTDAEGTVKKRRTRDTRHRENERESGELFTV